jgi:hypothetical protein
MLRIVYRLSAQRGSFFMIVQMLGRRKFASPLYTSGTNGFIE